MIHAWLCPGNRRFVETITKFAKIASHPKVPQLWQRGVECDRRSSSNSRRIFGEENDRLGFGIGMWSVRGVVVPDLLLQSAIRHVAELYAKVAGRGQGP